MREEVFDKLLRDKMSKDSLLNKEGLDWSTFSEHLDSIPELNPQTDPFDKLIQGALGGAIIQDTKGMDWGRFAEKLNNIPELEVDNVDFDQVLIDKVDKINYTYQPKDWENLSQRLDKEGLLNNHIISIKSFELLIFIFLIWGFQNFSNQEDLPHNFMPTMPSPNEVKDKATNNSDIIYSYRETNNKLIEGSLLNDTNGQLITDLTKSKHHQYSSPIINDSQIVVSAEKTNNDNSIINNILDLEKGLTENNFNIIPVASSLPSLGAIVIAAQKDDLLAFNKVSLYYINPNLKTTKDIKIQGTPKSNRRLSVGLSGLAKVNYIHSTSETYSSSLGRNVEEEFSDVAISKGGGLSFNWENGNTTLSTGLEYLEFEFVNNPNVHVSLINGSGSTSGENLYADKINKIDMKMLSIPISLKYSYEGKNKWRPYVKGGMAVHFNVEQIINKSETFNYKEEEDKYLLEGAKVSNSYNIFEKDTNLPSNTYVSINFGVGLERNINSNLSFYVEPSFELNTKSKNLKVKGSRINAFGLRAGLSYYL